MLLGVQGHHTVSGKEIWVNSDVSSIGCRYGHFLENTGVDRGWGIQRKSSYGVPRKEGRPGVEGWVGAGRSAELQETLRSFFVK